MRERSWSRPEIGRWTLRSGPALRAVSERGRFDHDFIESDGAASRALHKKMIVSLTRIDRKNADEVRRSYPVAPKSGRSKPGR